MALWNLVATDFNSLDETINFGTRAFAESDECIYETATQATIDPDGEVSGLPKVTIFSYPGSQFWVAVNESMTAFSGESSLSVLYTQVYDSNVCLLSCTPDKEYLFVGLEKGTLLCIHSATSEKFLSWTCSELFEENGNFVNIFYHKGDTFVINSAGCICKILGFGCNRLEESGMLTHSTGPHGDIKFEKIGSPCAIGPVQSVSYKSFYEDFALIAVGNGVAVWTEEYGWDSYTDERLSLKKVHFLNNDPIALALSSSGQLLQICTVTLIVQVINISDKLTDFLVIGAPGHERVVAITQEGNDKKAALLIMNVPGFDVKLRLPIGCRAQLISLGDEEDILFLEFLEEDNSISGLAIKSAIQINPFIRLDRLLTRGRFDSALELAQNFNLDPSRVYETMALRVVESLQPWKFVDGMSSNQSRRLYKELISLLDKIKNVDFIAECCLNVVSSEFEISRSILRYAQGRVTAFSLNNPEEESKVANLSILICSSLLKIETMALIEPVWNADKWLKFSKRHPLDEVEERLKQGQINEAVLVWNRHLSETQEILKSDRYLPKLLDIIPRWVSLDAMISWLAVLLPAVISKQPAGVSRLVEWIIPKVKALENVSGSLWPDIGLKYMKQFLSLFSSEQKKLHSTEVPSPAVRTFAILIDALTDLCELKKTYGLFIALNDYLEDDHEEVANTLLSKLDERFLLEFLDNFLVKFFNERHLDQDTILTNYVERILRRSLGWWVWEEAPWEKRIITLLPRIENHEMRLKCVLQLLDEAPVPWSPTITRLVNDVTKLNHPLATRISEKKKQIAVNTLAKKYNIKAAIKYINIPQLVRLIIKRNLATMSGDIEQLVSTTESEVLVELCRMCAVVFFENGKYDEARVYLNKLEDTDAVTLCGALMEMNELTGSVEEDLLGKIGFHATIEHRLMQALRKGARCADAIANSRRLRNAMVLKLEFPFFNETETLRSKQQKLSDFIHELLREGKGDDFLPRIRRFADLMSIPDEEALVSAALHACQSGKMDLAVSASNMVVNSATVSPAVSFDLNSLISAFLKNGQSSKKTNEEIVETVHQLCVSSIVNSPAYCVQPALDLFSWVRTWSSLLDPHADTTCSPGDVLKVKRFSNLYCDSDLCGIRDVSISESLLKLFVQFETGRERNVSEVVLALEEVTQQLQENQRDLTAFALVCHGAFSFVGDNSSSNAPLGQILLKVVKTLVTKVLSSRHLDHTFAVSLLNHLGKDSALKLITSRMKRAVLSALLPGSAQMDFKKQTSLAKLGLTLSELWEDNVSIEEFRKVMIASSWGSRLPEYNVSAKGLFYDQERPNVLKKLLCAPNVTVDVIKNFCEDYQCDFQEALLLHLRSVLLSWEPDFVVNVQSDGKRRLVIRNTEQQLLERCHNIIQYADDFGPIKKMLKHIWLEINLYYHEIFLVVLQLLLELNSAVADHYLKSLLLRFLKSYLRRKAPDFDEENSWSDHFSSSSSLPPVAEFRLPYSRLIYDSSRSVISPEITLQSYSTWLTVADALECEADTMRVYAVRQSVSEEFAKQQNSNEAWCTSLKYNSLYEAVEKCVGGMTNLMMASACLYFFVNKTPPGADQLKAAKLCLEYTERLAQNPEYADKLEKVQNKYLHLVTTHVLYLCGLGNPEYLELVGSPEKLCYELYQHPAIVEYSRGNSAQCPNINSAVRKIGEFHNIGIDSLQMDLIKDWLQTCCEPNGDSSMDDFTFTTSSNTDDLGNNRGTENLFRALYVMEGGIEQDWVIYLNRLAFGSNAEINPTVRVRAMRCILMLTNCETVEKISGLDIASFRETLRCLEYIRELESLGFACSEKNFKNYNKEELATILLRKQVHKRQALSLIARLCLDYDVQQTSVWRTLLDVLTQRKLHEDLAKILPSITKLYHLWNTTEFKEAWNFLVLTPFIQAEEPPSNHQVSAMICAIEQLSKCPVLDKIALRRAADEAIRVGKIELAALLLSFCEESSRSELRKVILKSSDPDTVEGDLLRICSNSHLNFKQAVSYLRVSNDVE